MTVTPGPVQVYPSAMADLTEVYTFSYGGDLSTYVGQGRFYFDVPVQVRSIRATIGTTADQDVIIDVLKNGTTSIFSAPPRITTGQYTSVVTANLTTTQFARNEFLTVSILQAGLTQSGSDLTVTIRVKRLT